MQRVDYTNFLNRMLEAERAGAKALVVLMDDFPRNGPEWKLLRKIHEEEAHNCALIGKLLEKSGTPYSHATGEFYEKAVAVKGAKQRVEFLARGLRWAVQRFEEAAPTLEGESKAVFQRMLATHQRSIAACESIARSLP